MAFSQFEGRAHSGKQFGTQRAKVCHTSQNDKMQIDRILRTDPDSGFLATMVIKSYFSTTAAPESKSALSTCCVYT
jgi:hypothetical protein